MIDVLRRFQAASLDRNGNPLEVDGVFGQITFDALFKEYPLPGATLTSRVLAIAKSQIGISEVPHGSNRGPQVDLYLKTCGLSPGYPWCSAWVYWCFQQASRQLGIKNPCPKSAGVLNMWALAGYKESGLKRLTSLQVEDEPELVKPGMQFLMKFSATAGHTGLVESVGKGGLLTTIEGNTAQNTGTREGNAVCRLTRRRIDSINLGFISYQ
ncbi:CHAP domain-containing protein [Spirosoma sp. HMF4905]|uniref:CHAP domain-containing protein n=2 Tax=Spirosoma arboris TaxID=2682092 RepID=A0A7K1SIK2_9BACT|nr:CHAP domain-containing protein [Spirosoma arboris]